MFQEHGSLTQTDTTKGEVFGCCCCSCVVFFCFDFMVDAQRGFPESLVPALSRSQAGDIKQDGPPGSSRFVSPFRSVRIWYVANLNGSVETVGIFSNL